MPDREAIKRRSALRLRDGYWSRIDDQVAVEAPLGFVVNGRYLTTTLRSPGDDRVLAFGYAFSAGLIQTPDDVQSMEFTDNNRGRTVALTLRKPLAENPFGEPRPSSQPDVIADIVQRSCKVKRLLRLNPELLDQCRNQMEDRQRLFTPTGSTHAAALFDESGRLLALGEDVGRHNAFDKAIGQALLDKTLSRAAIGFLSSRAGFEMVAKGVAINLSVLACTSGPTGLAIELAEAAGLTLVAFVRPGGMTVFSGAARLAIPVETAAATPADICRPAANGEGK